MSAKDIVRALTPGETQMLAFAHPVSEDARNSLAMLMNKATYGRLPEPYVKRPCGSCGMVLAVSTALVKQVDAGLRLRCPLCAAWLMKEAKARPGGWTRVIGEEEGGSVQ